MEIKELDAAMGTENTTDALVKIGVLLVEKYGPVLAEMLSGYIASFDDMTPNELFTASVKHTVRGINASNPEWPGEQKRSYAFDAIRREASSIGIEITDGQINRMIEACAVTYAG